MEKIKCIHEKTKRIVGGKGGNFLCIHSKGKRVSR